MASHRPKQLGKYELLARIAKGGMAEIYLARQRGMVGFSRLVVIKRILPHLAEEAEFVRMFMEEARLAALINHPNVVQIHDVGQYEGNYYMAMEFINGLSVGVISRRARELQQPVPHVMAAEIVAQACAGLHAAHELKDETGNPLNLVHRDISPHNLMLSREGLVKLVDFGIAKAQDSAVKTRTGKLKGKYPYMSPEQCSGDALDRRTDIFSLGIVFHELVTGRRLFERNTELMILKAITEEPVPDPRETEPSIPEPISRVILCAMARESEQRYIDAAAMERAIRQALGELGVESSSTRLVEYLTSNYGDIIEVRAAAIDRVIQMRPGGDEPPVVSGFQEHRSIQSAETADSMGTIPPSTLPVVTLRRQFPIRRVLLLGLCTVILATAGGLLYRHLRPGRPSGSPLRFGLPPSFPADVGRQEMKPFLRYLERHLHRPVELVVPKTYKALRKQLLDGRLDFANLPALQLVLARYENPKLEVVVTQTYEKARRYQSYIIVREDSAIEGPEQLKNKRFCYVDPGSTSGFLLARHFFRRRGVDPNTLFKSTRFSGNHVKVMKDLVAGRCDAGAVYSGALMSAQSLGVATSRLRMLAVTGQIPYDVICASPQMPTSLARRLRRALLQMKPQRDLGRRVVGPTFRIDGFVKPKLSEFKEVQQAARSEGLTN